ncbi:MAG TPA: SMC-Scp complex subunit ScpB [bacterium]|nr:SMC-Scp complex subunit ScpB [bacterium]
METQPTNPKLEEILETLIFVSGRPLGTSEMIEATGASRKELEEALASLEREWEERGRGIQLIRVAEGYEFRSRLGLAPWIKALNRPKPQRLSVAGIETLALIAYRQPVTRSDIESVRGVDSGGVLKSLTDRRLIKCVGRKEEAGRPLLYATTSEFLELFGLKDLADLPPLQEFEEMAKSQAAVAAEEQGLDVADLITTPEELGQVAEEDRLALEELDAKLKDLKDAEKAAVEATTTPETTPGSGVNGPASET